jgi:aminoglycoside 3-N-acetyltransferase
MSIESVARRILPAKAVASLRRTKRKLERQRIAALPAISEAAFKGILRRDLRLTPGDTVYVHSSVDQLNLEFPFYRILSLIQEVIGSQGTVLFPTYPNHQISSYEYLKQGKIFDVKRTPSYTGILTEFARRQRASVRSLHPTKSVCAIGKYANELTGTHQLSPYPYDTCSPYFKLVDYRAKIIGLGVWTQYLSFVYCVDDALKEKFPVRVYHPEVFKAQCRNYKGELETVETFAHNMATVIHDVPPYMRKYIETDVCEDLKINGMKFFRADAAPLFAEMMKLAERGITVYSPSVYEKR